MTAPVLMLRCLTAMLLLAGMLAGAPVAADDAYEARDASFPSADGTMLHARVFRPASIPDEQATPVVLVVTPYRVYDEVADATGTGPDYGYRHLAVAFARGYTVVVVSLRGFGHSEGCGDLLGPGEQSDVVSAVEWAAQQPWSTGAVGMFGLSYDGWSGVAALAGQPEGLAAVVVGAPVVDAYRAQYLNGIPYTYWRAVVPGYYGAHDLVSGPAESGVPACYADTQLGALDDDPTASFWRERDLVEAASASRVPVFWTHGFDDINVKPDHFASLYGALRGPKQSWLGQFDHAFPRRVAGEDFADAAFDWFDRYLTQPAPGSAPQGPPVRVQDDDGRWRTERTWPPQDAVGFPIALEPGSYVDVAGRTALTGQAGAHHPGAEVWMFTQQLPYALHLAGPPVAELELQSERAGAYALVGLYDVDTDNRAMLITRGGGLLREAGAQASQFELYPQDWTLEPGHRLGMLVTGSDDSWVEPGGSAGTVHLAGGRMDIPFLRFERTDHVDGQPTRERPPYFGTTPIQLDDGTIDDNEVVVVLPPQMRPRG